MFGQSLLYELRADRRGGKGLPPSASFLLPKGKRKTAEVVHAPPMDSTGTQEGTLRTSIKGRYFPRLAGIAKNPTRSGKNRGGTACCEQLAIPPPKKLEQKNTDIERQNTTLMEK